MLIVVVVAFGLRLHRLGDANVWWDEGFGVWLARMSLHDAALRTAYDVHPPLYYFLLHFWRLLVGESEFALRFLSLLFGVVAVVLTYRLGRDVVSPGAGVLAAIFVTLSRFNVDWSQQIRMYSLATSLGLGSTWLALRLWRRGRGLGAYVLSAVALLHTLYLAALFLVLQNLLWLLHIVRKGKTGWWRWPLSQGLVAAGMVPWMLVFLPRMGTWSVSEPVTLWSFLWWYWGALIRGTTVHIESHSLYLAVSGLILVLAVAALVKAAIAGGSTVAWELLVAAAVPPILVFILAQPHAFFYSPRPETRYLNSFSPLFYLLWAAGLVAVWRWQAGLGGVLGAACVLLLALPLQAGYRSRIPRDDYRSLACTLRTYVRDDDLVYLHTDSDWPVFAYHYSGAWHGVPNDVAWDTESASGFLGQSLPHADTAWLVLTPDALRADPHMSIEAQLARWCAEGPCYRSEWHFGSRRLVRFSRDGGLPEPSTAPARLVVRGEGLKAAWWPYARIRAGSQWRAYVWWDRASQPWPSMVLRCGQGSLTVEPLQVEEHEESSDTVRLAYGTRLPGAGRCSASLNRGGQSWLLTRLLVEAEPAAVHKLPGDELRPVSARFGDQINLEQFATSGDVLRPGQELCVTLVWRADDVVLQPYAVFVHLLGETFNAEQGNFLWGQHDGQPVDGARPLPSWTPGEAIIDRHCFEVARAAPDGDYFIEVGLYDPTSGQRLPVTSGGEGDRIILTQARVASP